MIFYLDSKPLIVRIEAGATGNSPAFQHTVKLEPEIIMQARSRMFLHQITETGGCTADFARRLRRFFEIPFRIIFCQLCHVSQPYDEL